MSMFMNVFIPLLYIAGLFFVVLFVLALFMLMRNKIDHQELTNVRMTVETDLMHAFKERELVALARDNVMLQQLEAKIERKYKNSLPVARHVYKGNAEGPLTKQRDNSNSWEGNFKEFQPECGLKSESTDVPPGPLSEKTFYEGHAIKDMTDYWKRDWNIGVQNDPNAVHPAGTENALKPEPEPEPEHDYDQRYGVAKPQTSDRG